MSETQSAAYDCYAVYFYSAMYFKVEISAIN